MNAVLAFFVERRWRGYQDLECIIGFKLVFKHESHRQLTISCPWLRQ